jgi:hypothetical protein
MRSTGNPPTLFDVLVPRKERGLCVPRASMVQAAGTSLGVIEATVVRAAQEPEEELPRPAVVVLWLFVRLGCGLG